MESFEALFEAWEQEWAFRAFVRDGIVDFERYEKPRLLFVLREMNTASGGDLRRDLRENGSGWKTWNNVGRWTKALLDGEPDYPERMPKTERIAQLRRIAVLNLKKEGGASRVDGGMLFGAVEQQHERILQEIELCAPSLILCCGLPSRGVWGSAELLKQFVFPDSTKWSEFPSQTFARRWQYYETRIQGKRVPVIGFCHPQVTCLEKARGHEALFRPLYRDMLEIRRLFLEI